MMYKTILILPDLHIPFCNWDLVKQADKWCQMNNPDLVIQLGDLMDQKAWSRWPKEADDLSPHQEFEQAMRDVAKLQKMFPDLHVLMGNHDLRIAKKALEVGFSSHILRSMQDVFDCPNWTWHTDPNEKFIVKTKLGEILFVHGDEQGGTVAAKSRLLGMSVVQGHTHQASLTYSHSLSHFVFGMECGHLMDITSKAAIYAMRSSHYPVEGFGVIVNGIPSFIPLKKTSKTSGRKR